MLSATTSRVAVLLSAGAAAAFIAVACGGSNKEAESPANEGTEPATESTATEPNGAEMGAGGAAETGGSMGETGGETATPPEGYGGSQTP